MRDERAGHCQNDSRGTFGGQRCSRCHIFKPASDYAKCRTRITGLQAYCLPCKNTLTRERRSQGKDKIYPYPYRKIRIGNKVVAEHRHVVQVNFGIQLPPSAHVHHINGDKKDNRIENLSVVTARAHGAMHHGGM